LVKFEYIWAKLRRNLGKIEAKYGKKASNPSLLTFQYSGKKLMQYFCIACD